MVDLIERRGKADWHIKIEKLNEKSSVIATRMISLKDHHTLSADEMRDLIKDIIVKHLK